MEVIFLKKLTVPKLTQSVHARVGETSGKKVDVLHRRGIVHIIGLGQKEV